MKQLKDSDNPAIEAELSMDQYDAVEIHGIKEITLQDGNVYHEQSEDQPNFVSVFLHLKEGGLECVADLASYEEADQYAKDIAKQYNLSY